MKNGRRVVERHRRACSDGRTRTEGSSSQVVSIVSDRHSSQAGLPVIRVRTSTSAWTWPCQRRFCPRKSGCFVIRALPKHLHTCGHSLALPSGHEGSQVASGQGEQTCWGWAGRAGQTHCKHRFGGNSDATASLLDRVMRRALPMTAQGLWSSESSAWRRLFPA